MNRLTAEVRARAGLKSYLVNHPHEEGIIVWPDRRLIYMKPCKTAGTSILRRCLEVQLDGAVHLKDHPEAFKTWLGGITDDDLESYFIFSFVRNPWDRVVSAAHYFEIGVEDLILNYDAHTTDDNVRIHCLPLYHYTHHDGQAFADYVGRFETLQEDFNVVCDRVGLSRRQLPHAKRTDHKHYSHYYSDHTRKRVAELYEKDLAYFGYTFAERPSRTDNVMSMARSLVRAGRALTTRLSSGGRS